GWNVLQIPPMNLSNMDCPYSVESSRLMDWLYISPDMLLGKSSYRKFDGLSIRSKQAEEYLKKHQQEIEQLRNAKNTDFGKVKPIVYETLKIIWKDFSKLPQTHRHQKAFLAYKNKMPWLKDHILHVLLKEKFAREKDMWRDWDFRLWGEALARRQPEALKEAEKLVRHTKEGNEEIDLIEFHSFMQWVFYHQWNKFKTFAHSRNVGLAGDMTFGLDGADLWIHQELFAFDKDLKRRYTQGVPPDLFSDMGQYWQFYMYKWEKPETVNFIFERFRYLLGFYDYVRFDHALGCYRGYRFLEDVDNQMNLKDLGIQDEINSLLEEGKLNPSKQDEIAKKVYDIVLRKLAATNLLTDEDKKYFFTPAGTLSRDSAIYIVRRADKQPGFEPKLAENGWERYNYVTEKRISDASYNGSWDFLPFSKKYIKKYLFPDDSQRAPKIDDSVRIGYFVPAPGEEIISGLLRIAQEEGKVFITELLGVVPEEAKKSVDTLAGAIDYAPGIFQDNPGFWMSDEFKNKWTLVVHSLQDSINMEGKKATGNCNPIRDVSPEQAKVTMTDDERMKWLGPLMQSKALLAILMWPDWGKWSGSWTERITNIPGTQTGNWSCKTPVAIEELLRAARGKKSAHEAKSVVDFARTLTVLSKRDTSETKGFLSKYIGMVGNFSRYIPDSLKGSKYSTLINTFPYFGNVRQQRFLDEKFEVWALVNKKPKNIYLHIGENNARISLPMHTARVNNGLSKDVYLYVASIAANTLKEGDHYFTIEVNGKEAEGKGWLQAVKRGDSKLNPVLVPDYRTASSVVSNPMSDELYKSFKRLQQSEFRNQILKTFWSDVERIGAPLIGESQREDTSTKIPVVFLYKGAANSVALAGDMTGWWPERNQRFKKFEGTDLWYLEESFDARTRLDYKISVNNHLILDPLNPRKSAAKYKEYYIDNSELVMPDFKRPEELKGKFRDNERLKKISVPSPKHLKYDHDVWIYLPPQYNKDDRTQKYPAVYFQDGYDYLNLGNAAVVLDNLINTKQIQPIIGVFVEPAHEENRNRVTEYTINNRYNKFFARELVAFIDTHYNTINDDPTKRLVVGYCFGGLISLYIALHNPSVFANVASQSACVSLHYRQIFTELAQLRSRPAQSKLFSVYMSAGKYSTQGRVNGHKRMFNFLRDNKHFRDRLIKNGYEKIKYAELYDGHSWGCWRNELPDILRHFFAVPSASYNQVQASSSTTIIGANSRNKTEIQRRRFIWSSVALKTLSLPRLFPQKPGLSLKQPFQVGSPNSPLSCTAMAASKESVETGGRMLQATPQKLFSQRFSLQSQDRLKVFHKAISSVFRPVIIFAKTVNAYFQNVYMHNSKGNFNINQTDALHKSSSSASGSFIDSVWQNLRGHSLETISQAVRTHVRLLDKNQLRSLELSVALTKAIFPKDYGILLSLITQSRIQVVATSDIKTLVPKIRNQKALIKNGDRIDAETTAVTLTQVTPVKRSYVIVINEREFLIPACLLANIFHEMVGHIARYENPAVRERMRGIKLEVVPEAIEFAACYREATGLKNARDARSQLSVLAEQGLKNDKAGLEWVLRALNAGMLNTLIQNAEAAIGEYLQQIQTKTEVSSFVPATESETAANKGGIHPQASSSVNLKDNYSIANAKAAKGSLPVVVSVPEQRSWPHIYNQLREEGEAEGRILTSLGADFAKWWIYRVLKARANKIKNKELPTTISGRSIRARELDGRSLSLFTGSIPEQFVSELKTYGYRKKKDNVFVLNKPYAFPTLQPSHFFKANKVVGVIKEPLIPIPNKKNRAIYSPHMGKGQTSYSQQDAMREGLSDAECVIKYLRAYNRLIKMPTAISFFRATIQPNTSTGPFWTTMDYLLKHGISHEFLTLLHVGFYLHWILFSGRLWDDKLSRCEPIDLWIFQKVLEKFCRDHCARDTINKPIKDWRQPGKIKHSQRRMFGWAPYSLKLIKEPGLRRMGHLLKEDIHIFRAFVGTYGFIRGPTYAFARAIATRDSKDPAFYRLPIYYQNSIEAHEIAHQKNSGELFAYKEELRNPVLTKTASQERYVVANLEIGGKSITDPYGRGAIHLERLVSGAYLPDSYKLLIPAGFKTTLTGITAQFIRERALKVLAKAPEAMDIDDKACLKVMQDSIDFLAFAVAEVINSQEKPHIRVVLFGGVAERSGEFYRQHLESKIKNLLKTGKTAKVVMSLMGNSRAIIGATANSLFVTGSGVADKKYAIGIDLGGTNIRAALIDLETMQIAGEIALADVLPDEASRLAMGDISRKLQDNSMNMDFNNLPRKLEAFLPEQSDRNIHGQLSQKMLGQLVSVIQKFDLSNVAFVSIGAPGIFDEQGPVKLAYNLPTTRVDVTKALNTKFGLPIYMGNDVACAGVGEIVAGSGKGFDELFVLNVGTGLNMSKITRKNNTPVNHKDVLDSKQAADVKEYALASSSTNLAAGSGDLEQKFFKGKWNDKIYDSKFINPERIISSQRPTVVFDLDETIAYARKPGAGMGMLRPGIEKELDILRKEGIRLVLWTRSSREGVRAFFKQAQHQHVPAYFDLIITSENYIPKNTDDLLQIFKTYAYYFGANKGNIGINYLIGKLDTNSILYPDRQNGMYNLLGIDFCDRINDYFLKDFVQKDLALLGYRLLVEDDPNKEIETVTPAGSFLLYRLNPDLASKPMPGLAMAIIEMLKATPSSSSGKQGYGSSAVSLRSSKSEIIDIIDDNDKVVGSIDRNVAHLLGLRHRTAMAFVVTPTGKILIQRRAPGLRLHQLYLCIFGGHVKAGQNYEQSVMEELKEELDLEKEPQGKLSLLGYDNYQESGITNKERRGMFTYFLTEDEYSRVIRKEQALEGEKSKKSKEDFEIWLKNEQVAKTGHGAVWGYYEKNLSEILEAARESTYVFDENRGEIKLRYFELKDTFAQNSVWKSKAYFTPDVLERLLNNREVINSLKSIIEQYFAPKQALTAKADYNELPLQLVNPKARKHEFLQVNNVNRYARRAGKKLIEALSIFYYVNPESIFIHNGSDAVMEKIFMSLIGDGKEAILVVPNFTFTDAYLSQRNIKLKKFSLSRENEYRLDPEALEKIITKDTVFVTFANPNSPTGSYTHSSKFEELIKKYPNTIFHFDEAYGEFADGTAIGLTKKYNNVIVSRSFSKALGLANLRIGYAIASADIIKKITPIPLFPVSEFIEDIAVEVFKDRAHLKDAVNTLAQWRQELIVNLSTIEGIKVYPSTANFILVDLKDINMTASQVKQALSQHGVEVADVTERVNDGHGYLRITVCNPEENRLIYEKMKEVVENNRLMSNFSRDGKSFDKVVPIMITSPSAAGKDELLFRLKRELGDAISIVVRMTSRKKRKSDIIFDNYDFVRKEDILESYKHGELAMLEENYGGNLYAIRKADVDRCLAEGKIPVVIVNPYEGKRSFKENYPQAVSIFISPLEEEWNRKFAPTATAEEKKEANRKLSRIVRMSILGRHRGDENIRVRIRSALHDMSKAHEADFILSNKRDLVGKGGRVFAANYRNFKDIILQITKNSITSRGPPAHAANQELILFDTLNPFERKIRLISWLKDNFKDSKPFVQVLESLSKDQAQSLFISASRVRVAKNSSRPIRLYVEDGIIELGKKFLENTDATFDMLLSEIEQIISVSLGALHLDTPWRNNPYLFNISRNILPLSSKEAERRSIRRLKTIAQYRYHELSPRSARIARQILEDISKKGFLPVMEEETRSPDWYRRRIAQEALSWAERGHPQKEDIKALLARGIHDPKIGQISDPALRGLRRLGPEGYKNQILSALQDPHRSWAREYMIWSLKYTKDLECIEPIMNALVDRERSSNRIANRTSALDAFSQFAPEYVIDAIIAELDDVDEVVADLAEKLLISLGVLALSRLVGYYVLDPSIRLLEVMAEMREYLEP
ncbi:MAG: 4-alpha-glucanotransferase, partial [Candidatus Omnitrophota bacterium]